MKRCTWCVISRFDPSWKESEVQPVKMLMFTFSACVFCSAQLDPLPKAVLEQRPNPNAVRSLERVLDTHSELILSNMTKIWYISGKPEYLQVFVLTANGLTGFERMLSVIYTHTFFI